MNFKLWLEDIERQQKEKLISLYQSLLDPKDIARYRYLNKAIEDAYKSKNYKLAEKLEEELENLSDSLENKLHDMDELDPEDVRHGTTGGEDDQVDWDYSVQDEFARIYAKYLKGGLLQGYEDVEADSSFRNDPEFIRKMKVQGYAMAPKGAYERRDITAQRELANLLRSAIYESPYIGMSKPKVDYIKNLSDEQIIDMAKDAYENKSKMLSRIRGSASSDKKN